MNISEIGSQLLILIGILVVIVNIITEVVKRVLELKKPQTINIFATCTSIILTMLAFYSYFDIINEPITWYMQIAFIIVGFMVAYSAMFGYDKLLSYFKKGE